MPSYMPQDLFDMVVVTAVKLHMTTGNSLDHVCETVCGFYNNNFPDDTNLKAEVSETSSSLLKAMRLQFDDEQLPSAMTQLQFCITNFELDGSKKRKRLLSGTLFTRSKSHNPKRAKDCLRNMMVFHTGTMTGVFPVAPTGWSMENR